MFVASGSRMSVWRRFCVGLASAVALVSAARAVHADAFLQPEGHGQLIVERIIASAEAKRSTSGAMPLSPWSKLEYAAAFEVGATDWATVLASGAWDALTWDPCGCGTPQLAKGGGVSSVGTRLALWQVPNWTGSVEVNRVWPGAGARQWVGAPESVAGTEVKLQTGTNFVWIDRPGFVEAALGTKLLAAPYAAEQQLDLTFGFRPTTQAMVLVQEFGRFAAAGGPLPERLSSKLQLSTVYFYKGHYAVHAGVYDTVYARGVAPERGVVSGVWYRF